jgi:D-alanyl-D-alanine carboxypeptidase
VRLTRRGRLLVTLTTVTVLVLLALAVTALLSGRSHPTAARAADRSAVGGSSGRTPSSRSPATAGGSAAPSTPSSPAAPQYSISDPTSIWVVVNKLRPLQPKTYVPADLASVGDGQVMRAPAAGALLSMFAAAESDGLSIHADSGYRSYTYQVSVHDRAAATLGAVAADGASALPGYSEHQTGWAVDVGGDGCDIAVCFGSTPAGRWVAANAWRFGFLVRYPAGEEAITGYEYEPWHIRYVGTELSTRMHDAGVLTLEQEFGLPPAPNYPS